MVGSELEQQEEEEGAEGEDDADGRARGSDDDACDESDDGDARAPVSPPSSRAMAALAASSAPVALAAIVSGRASIDLLAGCVRARSLASALVSSAGAGARRVCCRAVARGGTTATRTMLARPRVRPRGDCWRPRVLHLWLAAEAEAEAAAARQTPTRERQDETEGGQPQTSRHIEGHRYARGRTFVHMHSS